jgi:anti-sigma regulatory factor (Ser/Thr protein kinase)
MTEHESIALATRSLRLPAARDHYPALVDAVEAFGRENGIDRRREWYDFLTAVSEIGANALTYAYEGREPGDVEMELARYSDRVEARLRDRGVPFVEPPQPDPLVSADPLDVILALEESGRGLAIARLALTEMGYTRTPEGINTWRLVKKL